MRHDTPADSIRALRSVETLEAAYASWAELRRDGAARKLRHLEELRRLDSEGKFLLGAIRAAGDIPVGSAPENAIVAFSDDASQRLAAARAKAEDSARAEERAQEAGVRELIDLLEARVQRYLKQAPPSLVLWRRPMAGDRAVLHLAAPGPEASVLLLYLTTGQVAARLDFLSDDTTEAMNEAPPSFYNDPDGPQTPPRPPAPEFPALARPNGKVSPVKGFVPVFVPLTGGGEAFYRLLRRGPVLEAELLDGATGLFRSVLTGPESELLAGQLLRWKLSGAVTLRLELG